MHPQNQKYDIIIDTDCAVDDLRAITMLCALKEVNIKAIITSDGTLSPEIGARKIKALLQSLGRLNVPVGIGRKTLIYSILSGSHIYKEETLSEYSENLIKQIKQA